jgi:hypothetical protein
LVYGASFMASYLAQSREVVAPVVVAVLCAFAGTVLGKRLLQKVTLRAVQRVVAGMMLLIDAGLVAGLI